MIPSVARIGDTRTTEISTPLMIPTTKATETPANSITINELNVGSRWVHTQAITSALAFAVAMMDKLMPPVSMVIAIANVNIPATGICEAMDWKLAADQNTCGISTLNTPATSTSSATNQRSV
ncbi:hypothetical protein D3C80_1186410 [compost metagenome]